MSLDLTELRHVIVPVAPATSNGFVWHEPGAGEPLNERPEVGTSRPSQVSTRGRHGHRAMQPRTYNEARVGRGVLEYILIFFRETLFGPEPGDNSHESTVDLESMWKREAIRPSVPIYAGILAL